MGMGKGIWWLHPHLVQGQSRADPLVGGQGGFSELSVSNLSLRDAEIIPALCSEWGRAENAAPENAGPVIHVARKRVVKPLKKCCQFLREHCSYCFRSQLSGTEICSMEQSFKVT